MDWSNLFTESNQPTLGNISDFIGNVLFDDFKNFIENTYQIAPKLSYSKCSMQKGWNIKFQKSGKSLCTLYPMPGYFITLVVVGQKEKEEVELLLPYCSEYTKSLYNSLEFFNSSKWLMINVMDKKILDDVKDLIQIRVKPKIQKRNSTLKKRLTY